ncbi:unnamed protein product [Onchocerca ochengi]|uniref:PDZ domain-containing protein n=1 Tax=Onchocerca ochengi TaxID=42157 RepID=A0A182EFS8_ONCOC|nr:unnamed protein product [Onchocerca ochengi]
MLFQTLLKDVWQELLASEFLSKGAKFDLSEKERQPSLSASIETTPSTSVVVQEDKSQPVSSTGKLDSSKNICRKVKNMMDKLKTSNSEETQKLSQSGIPTLSEQSNLERTVSEAEQIIIQDEIRQNSIAEAILINPSMSTNFPDSLPSSLSSEKSTSPKSNRFWGQPRTVILDRKPNQSFGISIVGGRVEVSNKSGQSGAKSTVSGIFIKSVLPNSPAGLSNMMHMGDRVISVNDQDLREATHEEAVQVIKNAKNPVKFVVQSLQSFPQFESDISEEKDENRDENEKNMSKLRKETECDNSSLTNTINAPEVPTKSDIISTLSEESDIHLRELIAAETDARKESLTSVTPKIDLQKRIKFKFGEMKTPKTAEIIEKPLIDTDEKKLEEMQTLEKLLRKRGKERGESRSTDDARRRAIDPCSAAALPKRDDDPEEEDLFFYTKDKINRKYGNLMGETMLLKLDKVPHSGLGLSLASNREHDRTIILVVAVKPTCPLSVKIGDELLEVNGKVLTGLSHLNASSIMRQCCEHGILELLLLRRFEAL